MTIYNLCPQQINILFILIAHLISIIHLKSTFFRKCYYLEKKTVIKQYFSSYTLSSSFFSFFKSHLKMLLEASEILHSMSYALSNCRVTSPSDLVFLSSSSAVRIISTVGPKVLGCFHPLSISDWPKQMARSLHIAGLLFFHANSNSGLFAFIFCYFCLLTT